jgi:hypothetical protein
LLNSPPGSLGKKGRAGQAASISLRVNGFEHPGFERDIGSNHASIILNHRHRKKKCSARQISGNLRIGPDLLDRAGLRQLRIFRVKAQRLDRVWNDILNVVRRREAPWNIRKMNAIGGILTL